MRIVQVDSSSVGKSLALVYMVFGTIAGMIGLICVLVTFVVHGFGPGMQSQDGTDLASLGVVHQHGFGLGWQTQDLALAVVLCIAGGPIIGALLGLIGGVLNGWFYNVAAGWAGGVEIRMAQDPDIPWRRRAQPATGAQREELSGVASVNVWTVAKTVALMDLLYGFLMMALAVVTMMLVGNPNSPRADEFMGTMLLIDGFLYLVVFPMLAYLYGALTGAIYNLVASQFGGIEIWTKIVRESRAVEGGIQSGYASQSKLALGITRVDIWSASKVAGLLSVGLGLILTVVVTLFIAVIGLSMGRDPAEAAGSIGVVVLVVAVEYVVVLPILALLTTLIAGVTYNFFTPRVGGIVFETDMYAPIPAPPPEHMWKERPASEAPAHPTEAPLEQPSEESSDKTEVVPPEQGE